MMRLLYLPLDVPGSEQHGLRRAFEGILGKENILYYDYLGYSGQGHEPLRANMHLLELVDSFTPTWLHGQFQETGVIQADALLETRRRGVRIITHWTGDCRTQVSPYLASICKVADITFISSTGQIPMFKVAGAKDVRYWQIAVDWFEDLDFSQLAPTFQFRVPEVVFCGTNYGHFPDSHERFAVVEAFANSGLDFGILGHGWPGTFPVLGQCGVKQQKWVYGKAKVSLGCNNFNHVENFFSDRQLVAMAAGTAHLCRDIPGLNRYFEDGVHCRFWITPDEAVGIARELLADKPMRERIGRAGRGVIIRHHTWFSRVLEILPQIEDFLVENR